MKIKYVNMNANEIKKEDGILETIKKIIESTEKEKIVIKIRRVYYQGIYGREIHTQFRTYEKRRDKYVEVEPSEEDYNNVDYFIFE